LLSVSWYVPRALQLVEVSRTLAERADRMIFTPPVTHVYNPLIYARASHEAYLERWGTAPKAALLLGMNPGPFGMAQTGIPFGEVSLVRSFLGIEAQVKKPPIEHPKRPVFGFDCRRSEVSGARLWGWARDRFRTPQRFFEQFFVVNYCPLAFMEESGRNRTPDKLPTREREQLFSACDQALREIVDILRPSHVIGVGGFAEERARAALAGTPVEITNIQHPSPANPQANRGWAEGVEKKLEASGVRLPRPG
jgi:single-strand selective monofunctional uracil DNA glycosylase